MSAIEWLSRRYRETPRRRLVGISLVLGVSGAATVAFAQDLVSPAAALRSGTDANVAALLKTRLPKTPISSVDCSKVSGLCEVTAGSNLFYVDQSGRYLVIGRVYDMQNRQDITAARLLEMNPDMLVGGAARANAAGDADAGEPPVTNASLAATRTTMPARPASLSLAGLPKDGSIVWGSKTAAQTVTVFTDFRCGYCRALTSVLRTMNVRVVERPISILGSRDIADRVYCAKNQEAALHAAYAGSPINSDGKCDTRGLDANERFAEQHGLSGTPIIVRSDGAMLEGYRPKEFLEAWLRGSKS
jgi:thiol:disulfide interchange protein DsbC